MSAPPTRRRVRRTKHVVQSLRTELRIPLVAIGGEPARTIDGDTIIAGETTLGAQRLLVVLDREDDGRLVAILRFSDREDL